MRARSRLPMVGKMLLPVVLLALAVPAGAGPADCALPTIDDRCEAWASTLYYPAYGVTTAVAASADRVFVLGETIGARDAATGAEIWTSQPPDAGSAIALSPDGSVVYAAGRWNDGIGSDGGFLEARDAKDGEVLWTSLPEDLESWDHIAVDRGAGVVYVAGRQDLSGSGRTDVIVAAYDPGSGERLWSTTYAGAGGDFDRPRGIAVSPSGDRVFVGCIAPGEDHVGDFVTLALEAADPERLGDFVWTATYKGNGFAAINSLALSPDGSRVVVTGTTGGIVNPAPGLPMGADYLTIAYTAATGAREWVARFDSPMHLTEFAADVAVSPDGERVFVTGEMRERPLVSQGVTIIPPSDYGTVAYDARTGAQLWFSRYSGPGDSWDRASLLQVSPDGTELYVSGFSRAEYPRVYPGPPPDYRGHSATGDDAYRADIDEPRPQGGLLVPGALGAQGYTEAGVGILADLAGDDVYRIADTTDTGPTPHFVLGQGYARVGMAVAMDADGDDDYLLDARPGVAVGEKGVRLSGAYASGFGAAWFGGAALHLDGGGSDVMTLRAGGEPITPDEVRPVMFGYTASVYGFGWGIDGTGLDLSGDGPTTRSALAEASAPLTSDVVIYAMGVGYGGYGALFDEGGNDVYVARATSRAARTASIGDGCSCDSVEATAHAGRADATMGGVGLVEGYGVLHDGGGDDRYEAVGDSSASAVAVDERTSFSPPGDDPAEVRADAETAPSSWTRAQGFGQQGGAGFLHDAAGHDSYEAAATTLATATATADHSGAATQATANTGSVVSQVQAASWGGYGELRDGGGRDAYGTSSESTATADPPGAETAGTALSSVLGSVMGTPGTASFADLGGEADTFFAVPADPACVGTKGTGEWLDCFVYLGVPIHALGANE